MIDGVKARRRYEDTVIVITSDHGEPFRENGAVGHFFSLYGTAVRVPLFIRVPGAKSGRVEHRKGQLGISSQPCWTSQGLTRETSTIGG